MAYESEHGLSTGESNNSISTANLLAENEKTIGALSSASDADYYKVVVEGPGLIDITFDTGSYSSTSAHWDIALLDTSGQDYLLSPARSAAGTSVKVNGEDQTGTSLIVDGLSAAPAAGDRFTIATSGADTTIYTVVSTTTPSSGEATLTLNQSISTAPADDATLVFDPVQASVGTSTTLTAQVTAAGTYYLKVIKADVASTQEYGVTVVTTSTVEVEDNDSKQDAADSNNRLLEGITMTGSLSGDNDDDIWLFTTASASDFAIDFAAANGNDATPDWTISIDDWNGSIGVNDVSAGTSASLSVSNQTQAKTYVVTVDKHADKSGVSTSDYTLKVSGTSLDLNDTPSMTIGSVTSDSSNALVDTEVVSSLSAAESGDGEALALTSLFSATDADSSQTLSYLFTLEKPQGSNSTGFIKVGTTSYGFDVGMTSPVNVSLTASEMNSASFYPGTGTGDLTLYLQAKDDSGANDGSDLGAIMQMTLRVTSAGYKVNVTSDTGTSLQESNASSTDTVTVSLGTTEIGPVGNEIVTVYLEHDGEEPGAFQLDYSTSVLTFNSTNWNTPQSVTVTAREDLTKESSQTGALSFRVVSSDSSSNFNDLAVDTLTYTLVDASNHEPTGSVTLSGTATQGQELTASNDVADVDGLGTITYKWEQSSDGSIWSTIAGSTTGATYTLADAQAGEYVRVTAEYTDEEANEESVVSDATALIANINDAPTLDNAISDQSAIAGRLYSYTFASDTFSDVDPTDDGGTLTYTIKQITSETDTTEISGNSNVITGSSPWLSFDSATRTFSSSAVGGVADDVVYIQVTATDNATTPASVTDIFKITVGSAATGTPVLEAALVDQSATEDSAFSYTVATNSFSDTANEIGGADTTNDLVYTATLSDGAELPTWLTFNSTALSFSGTPANADVGTLSVKLTATDQDATTPLSTSDIFDIAVANTNDDPTGAVDANSSSVAVTQGNTLTASNTLADVDGIGTISYQWQSSADNLTWSAIDGASATTYKLTQSEVGKYVRVVASYTDDRGTAESVESTATAAVANINDAPAATADTATAVEASGVANATAGTDPTGNVLTNDSDPDSDDLTVTAINGGTIGASTNGTYGALTLYSDGSYSYVLDNSNATVQGLRGSSNTLTDTFSYTVSDTGGLTDSVDLVVTIQGANDAPTVSTAIDNFDDQTNADNKVYADNAWTYTFASDTFADIDNGDSLTYSATQADDSALPTWLAFDGDTRTFSTTNAPTAGASVDVKVTATDLGSLTITDTFTVTVQDPGPEVPTLASPTAISLTDTASDDTFTSQTGTLDGTESSSGSQEDDLVYGISGGTDNGTTVSTVGSYGTLTVTKADGSYSFAPNDSVIEALTGDVSESFIVTVTDSGNSLSASRLLTINVTGANDAPTLTAPSTVAYTDTSAEDDFTATSGTLSGNDLDTDASLTYGISGGTDAGDSVTKTGSFGTLSVTKATGDYTFTPDDTVVNATGYDESESYTVTVSDGVADPVTETLSVSITAADDSATNDRPSVTTVGTLTGASEQAGTFTITYDDLKTAALSDGGGNLQDQEAPTSLPATYYSFQIESVSSGSLSKGGVAVTAGETTLSSGQSLLWTLPEGVSGDTEAFTIVAIDNQGLASSTPVGVTINIEPDSVLDNSGVIENSDANEAGANADGTTQAGVDVSVTTADALMANVTDTLAEGATRAVTRAKHENATSYTDISSGTLTIDGTYGQLTVNDDGTYSYSVPQTNTSVQQMGEDDSLTDTFSITLRETGGAVTKTGDQQLNIIIDGTNDLPTGTVTVTGTATQGQELSANLSSLSDAEGVGTPSYQWQSSSDDGTTWGDITDATSIAYTLTQSEVGQLVRVAMHYTDNAGAAESVTSSATTAVANANDAPVAVDDTGSATEAGGTNNGTAGSAATGNVLTNDTDVDTAVDEAETKAVSAFSHTTGGAGTLDQALTGTYGSLTLSADGSYTYAINDDNSAVEALRTTTDTLTDTFTYTVADAGALSDQGSLVITVQGANDAPTVSSPIPDQTESVYTGNGWEFIFATDTFADVDTGDTLTYSAVQMDAASGGSETTGLFSGDGGWLDFDAATRTFSSASAGADGSYYVKVTATDTAGLSISDTFTITVQDVGDQLPTLTQPTSIGLSDTAIADSFVAEEATLSGAAGTSGSGNENLEYGISGVTAVSGTATKVGTYGTLEVITSTGAYTFTPNATAIDALTADAVENFLVTVTDTGLTTPLTASKQLAINLTAANDTPTLSDLTAIDYADTTAQGDLTTATSGDLSTLADDRDSGATLTYTLAESSDNEDGTVSKVGSYGTLTLTTATGAYQYQPNASAIDVLDDVDSATDSFTLGVDDGTATATKALTVNITGADDTPAISSATTGTIAENAATSTVAYTAAADDPDGDAALVYSLSGTDAAAFVINSGTGEVTLNSAADFETQDSYAINVEVSDDAGATTVSQAVTISVTDENDAPTSSGGTVTAVAEEQYIFTAADFGFSDQDTADELQSVQIDSLPVAGSFLLSGVAVSVDDVITAADLTNQSLVFIPEAGASGTGYATFTYSVSDGTTYSAESSTMTINAGYSLTGTAEFWNGGAALDGIGVTVDTQSDTSAATTGAFALDAIADQDGIVEVSATLAGPADKASSGLTLTDVLAGLKLYLGKSLPESYSSPYNYIAADFDADGDVDLSDVLNMLKYYLGKETTNDVAPEWEFVDKADLSGDGLSFMGANDQPVSKTNTAPHVIDQDISTDDTIELVGVLRGDVDGSWEAS